MSRGPTLEAGTIRGAIEIDRSGAISSMAATVAAVTQGSAALRTLLGRPFVATLNATGLQQQLDATVGRASAFTRTLTDTAQSGTRLAGALSDSERAVRSLNDQSAEFARTLNVMGSSSTQAVAALQGLPTATSAVRGSLSALRADSGAVATNLGRVATRSEELGVAATSLSGRLSTLNRNAGLTGPVALQAAGALATLTPATTAYGAAAATAAASASALAAAINAAAAASTRAAAAAAAAATSTTARARAAATAAVAETMLARSTYAAATSATALSAAARQAAADIVVMRTAAAGGDASQLLGGVEQALARFVPMIELAGRRVQSVQTIWPLAVRAVAADATAAVPAVGRLGGAMLALPGPATAAATAAGGLGGALSALGVAALAVAPPLIGLGVHLTALNSTPVKLASEMRQTAVAFEVLIGSSAGAKKLLGDLKQLADTTPLGFPEVTSAAKRLLAMGIEAGKVTESVRMLGDVSSLLGQPLNDMAYIFGQIKSKGVATMEELNQLAERGVPIYSSLAKVMRVNETAIRGMASDGKVGFAEVEAAFVSMTSAGGMFSQGLDKAGRELTGLQSTAADAYAAIQAAIGDVLIRNLDLAGTVRQTTALYDAIKPVIVGAFDGGSRALAPFTDSLRSTIDLATQLSRVAGSIGRAMDLAFGEGSVASILKIVSSLNPLAMALKGITLIVDSVAFVVRQIADAMEAINTLLGSRSTLAQTGKAISDEDVAAAMRANREGRSGDAAAPTGADGPIAASGGGGAGGSARRSASSEESSAARAAQRVRDLQAEAVVGQLRAAGREYEASIEELNARYRRDLANIQSDEEWGALNKKYESDRAELDAKRREESMRALRASWLAADQAVVQGHIAGLKAAGKDLEARLAEIKLRFAPQIGDAGKTTAERNALQVQMEQELNAARADDAERLAAKKKTAEEKATREQTERAERAAGVQQRIADHQAAAAAAVLEAQGRTAEAELLRFDAQWTRRLSQIKDAAERVAAQQDYAAERALKLQQQADAADRSNGRASAAVRGTNAPSSVADAQERVRAARAGSGERELARLELRDRLGAELTAAEQARRLRLGERFGRAPALLGMPTLPSPLQSIAPLLNPVRPGSGSTAAGAVPPINVNANLANEDKLARAVVRVIEPIVDRKIDRLESKLRAEGLAHDYAGKVGGRL